MFNGNLINELIATVMKVEQKAQRKAEEADAVRNEPTWGGLNGGSSSSGTNETSSTVLEWHTGNLLCSGHR